jgi:hypothetical protein
LSRTTNERVAVFVLPASDGAGDWAILIKGLSNISAINVLKFFIGILISFFIDIL